MRLEIFPFFVSCGRSGSTLLRSIFDAHPDLAIPGESHFITKLLPSPRDDGPVFDAVRFVDAVVRVNWTNRPEEPTWIDQWGIGREVLQKAVLEANPQNYADAVRAVFASYSAWRGKGRYGDKTPAYIRHIKQIAELLPEARFVHLVRDGRNVALAYLNAPFGPSTFEEAALHWRARVLAGRKAGRELGPGRYLELKYEDLVHSPERYVRMVCEWLRLRFDPGMLDHRESVRGLAISDTFRDAHKNVHRPIQKGIRDWRTQMHTSHLERFELIARDALEAFDYEVAVASPRRRARSLVRVQRAYLEGKRLSRRLRGLESGNWW